MSKPDVTSGGGVSHLILYSYTHTLLPPFSSHQRQSAGRDENSYPPLARERSEADT